MVCDIVVNTYAMTNQHHNHDNFRLPTSDFRLFIVVLGRPRL